jgi:hypothetical protein
LIYVRSNYLEEPKSVVKAPAAKTPMRQVCLDKRAHALFFTLAQDTHLHTVPFFNSLSLTDYSDTSVFATTHYPCHGSARVCFEGDSNHAHHTDRLTIIGLYTVLPWYHNPLSLGKKIKSPHQQLTLVGNRISAYIAGDRS